MIGKYGLFSKQFELFFLSGIENNHCYDALPGHLSWQYHGGGWAQIGIIGLHTRGFM